MSVRTRTWKTKTGEARSAYVVQYSVDERDARGKRKRHVKFFDLKKDAETFEARMRAKNSLDPDFPEIAERRTHAIEFIAPIPSGKTLNGRLMVTEALRAAHPNLKPLICNVVVNVLAEFPPNFAVADVDNLLKPVLDAMKGVAWMDDAQVIELTVRRVPSRERRLRVKIWPAGREPAVVYSPITPELLARASALVDGIEVDLDAPIEGEVAI
jgi:Holliday junction resolvase RusA-like endonuclease